MKLFKCFLILISYILMFMSVTGFYEIMKMAFLEAKKTFFLGNKDFLTMLALIIGVLIVFVFSALVCSLLLKIAFKILKVVAIEEW